MTLNAFAKCCRLTNHWNWIDFLPLQIDGDILATDSIITAYFRCRRLVTCRCDERWLFSLVGDIQYIRKTVSAHRLVRLNQSSSFVKLMPIHVMLNSIWCKKISVNELLIETAVNTWKSFGRNITMLSIEPYVKSSSIIYKCNSHHRSVSFSQQNKLNYIKNESLSVDLTVVRLLSFVAADRKNEFDIFPSHIDYLMAMMWSWSLWQL